METIKDIDEKGRKVAIREQIIALVHKEVVPAECSPRGAEGQPRS